MDFVSKKCAKMENREEILEIADNRERFKNKSKNPWYRRQKGGFKNEKA